jgi:hypothetical protein
MRTDTHVSSGIRTYDPDVLTGEEILWLRPRGQCDNRILFLQIIPLISGDVAEIRLAKKSYIFWSITPYSRWKSTDVSEEHVASILRVEE